MKAVFCLFILVSAAARAEEAADRAAIDKLITGFNHARADFDKALCGQCASLDNAAEFRKFIDIHRALMAIHDRPWSEVTRPRIVTNSIRFLAPDVALLDAAEVQHGSVLERNIPLMLILVKRGGEWQLASVRVLAAGSLLN